MFWGVPSAGVAIGSNLSGSGRAFPVGEDASLFMAYELVAGSFEFRDLAERLRRLEEHLAVVPGEPLQALVAAAQDGIPGASAVSITTVHQGRFLTEASSSQRALDADQMQSSLQSGPCVDAVRNDQIYNPRDLAHDPRWPQFGPRVSAEVGFNSCLTYRLAPDLIIDAATHTPSGPGNCGTPADTVDAGAGESGIAAGRSTGRPRPFMTGSKLVGHRSSLNVYGDTAGAFGQDALVTGLVFATYAVGLITTAYAQDTIHHLEQTLVNARQIGVAIGILMHARKLTQDAAFNVLRIASQNSNRKISDLAAELAFSGALLPTRCVTAPTMRERFT